MESADLLQIDVGSEHPDLPPCIGTLSLRAPAWSRAGAAAKNVLKSFDQSEETGLKISKAGTISPNRCLIMYCHSDSRKRKGCPHTL